MPVLEEKVRGLESLVTELKSERDQYRQLFHQENEERKRLTMALTDQRNVAHNQQPVPRTPWILYVIGVSSLIATAVGVWFALRPTP